MNRESRNLVAFEAYALDMNEASSVEWFIRIPREYWVMWTPINHQEFARSFYTSFGRPPNKPYVRMLEVTIVWSNMLNAPIILQCLAHTLEEYYAHRN